jgi:hypothetical protein
MAHRTPFSGLKQQKARQRAIFKALVAPKKGEREGAATIVATIKFAFNGGPDI